MDAGKLKKLAEAYNKWTLKILDQQKQMSIPKINLPVKYSTGPGIIKYSGVNSGGIYDDEDTHPDGLYGVVDGYTGWNYWKPTPEVVIKKCTCGVTKTYGDSMAIEAHSNWCDLKETK